MCEPLVSIIVPIYNVKPYIDRCLNSLINQTYKNLEILLIDDGSNDGSEKLCDLYKIKDSRVKVVHKQNGGVSTARNIGLDIARGEYISFVDPDDYVTVNFIKKLYSLVSANQVLLGVCTVLNFDEKNKFEQRWPAQRDGIYNYNDYLRLRISCSVVDKLFHKSLFNKLRFPENIDCSEDGFLYYRLIYEAQKIACTSDALYFYFQRKGSLTHIENSKKYFDIFSSHYQGMKYMLNIGVSDSVLNSWYYTIWATFVGSMKQIKKNDKHSNYIDLIKNMYKEINLLVKTRLNLFNKLLLYFPNLMYSIKSIIRIILLPFMTIKRKRKSLSFDNK